MSSLPARPIPKAPAERTLFVAVTILSLAALAQIIAAAIALAPRVDFVKMATSFTPRPSQNAASEAPGAPLAPAENLAKLQEANALLAEGDKYRRVGNFQSAVEAMVEADRLAPNKSGVLFQMASDYAQLGQKTETVAVLNRLIALPPSADPTEESFRAQAQAALAQVGGMAESASASGVSVSKESASMRDDVGIPIGSVMGIVDVKLLDGEPSQKNLRVATKGSSAQKVDPLKFQATVDFYEQDDHGQIVHNDSPRPNEWLSGPNIDWANTDPEIFQVKYRMPLDDRGDLPPLQYYGYVVAIYYNGELQDQRADPPSLLNQYAPALHKDLPNE